MESVVRFSNSKLIWKDIGIKLMANKKREEKVNRSEQDVTVDLEAETPKSNISDAMVGQTLDGRFLIEKDLTEGGADAGGIGVVYLAQDTKLLGKRVVVKILQKAVLKSADILRKFQHEKEALIRLDHPNIVRILDSGTLSDGNPFMVMEYIPGHSLRRLLSERRDLSFEFCAHIIESVTSALGAAHAEKILHRDIKPENIMLTPQTEGMERVRVIDFGIARVEDAKLAPGTEIERAIGTVKYMSPEQLLGRLNQTPAGDIYSCAIVVYEMLMGEQPFKPTSITDMFELQKQADSFLPGQFRLNIPAEVRSLILSALAFTPSDRPQDMRKFGRELANALRVPRQTDDNFGKSLVDHFAKTEPLTSKLTDSLSVLTELRKSDDSIGKRSKNSKLPLYLGIGLVILAAVGSLIGVALWRSSPPVNTDNQNSNTITNTSGENPADLPSRELTYYLIVQKMRYGKPYEEPYRTSGQETFEKGYKFKMFFQSDAEGFFYLFNEDKDNFGKTTYNLLYPTPKNNSNSMPISARQQIETGGNEFMNNPGTEIVWLIWTAKKNDVIEAAKQLAFLSGRIKDETEVRQFNDFLQKYINRNIEEKKDTANQQTVIRGSGDIIVHRIELEHR